MDDDMFVMDGEAAPELETALEEKCTVKTAKAGAGVPKAWVVQNIKVWEMEEITTGSLEGQLLQLHSSDSLDIC